jgi:hypothetical protein
VRASTELSGYSDFPGLRQVFEVKNRVVFVKSGQIRERVHYHVTSLGPERADARRLVELSRGHWGIENRLFWVKDDSFREDRQVLGSHRAGWVLSLLRAVAINLLRGRCRLWAETMPLTGRAQWVAAYPAAILDDFY